MFFSFSKLGASGGGAFFLKQFVAVVLASLYAFLFTYFALKAINLFTPVRVEERDEEVGLDDTLHGENAYL